MFAITELQLPRSLTTKHITLIHSPNWNNLKKKIPIGSFFLIKIFFETDPDPRIRFVAESDSEFDLKIEKTRTLLSISG